MSNSKFIGDDALQSIGKKIKDAHDFSIIKDPNDFELGGGKIGMYKEGVELAFWGNVGTTEKPKYARVHPSNWEDYATYGIVIDNNNPSPECRRIGNMVMHRTLPVQSQMKGCILDDDGNVVIYLNPDNWEVDYEINGETVSYDRVLGGEFGQVMVEVPDHWCKFSTNEDEKVKEVRMSPYNVAGYKHIKKFYISAYQCVVEMREDGVKKLASVTAPSDSTIYFGAAHENNSSINAPQLPACYMSLTNSRTYAHNRGAGWQTLTWDCWQALTWLFCVEYATLNSQADFHEDLNSLGFHYGGLGAGHTVSDYIDTYDSYDCVPCGSLNAYGNYSMHTSVPNIAGTMRNVNSYRGVQIPFGGLWVYTDGLLLQNETLYYCDDPEYYGDTVTEHYRSICDTWRTDVGSTDTSGWLGYIDDILFGEDGWTIPAPKPPMGSSTTYYCDGLYCRLMGTNNVIVVDMGMHSMEGLGWSGIFTMNIIDFIASALADRGCRVCFLGVPET